MNYTCRINKKFCVLIIWPTALCKTEAWVEQAGATRVKNEKLLRKIIMYIKVNNNNNKSTTTKRDSIEEEEEENGKKGLKKLAHPA